MGKVVFLGVEGAGKSTLTAALATYFTEHEDNGWSLRPENKEAFAFLQRMPARFAAGELPAQTANFRYLRWSICYKDEPQRTLEVLDYPGEVYRLAFLDPDDDPNPSALRSKQQVYGDQIRELMGFVRGADQVFVLFNMDDSKNLDTDNANVDAVWVTMSSIKILSSLQDSPEVTLLITQADKLKEEGEIIDDVDQLVKKRIPLIGGRFKGLNKLLVSAKEYNCEHFGLVHLVSKLLVWAPLYQDAKSQMDKCLNNLEDGKDDIGEFDRLAVLAKKFDWFSSTAMAFTGKNEGWSRFIKEFREVKAVCDVILKTVEKPKARVDRFNGILPRLKFNGCKKYLNKLIEGDKEAISDSRNATIFFLAFFGVIVIFVLVVCIASAAK